MIKSLLFCLSLLVLPLLQLSPATDETNIALPHAVRPPAARDEGRNGLLRPGQGCTTIYATEGVQMFGANNEDFVDPLTKVSFVPASEGAFGRVYFGYENYWTEGGMNDQGLFFDGLVVGIEVPVPFESKEQFNGTNFLDHLMASCATVECVVDMFERYYTEETWAWQHLFGDATGESVIIEPATMLRQRGGCQVATNFYQSTTPPEERDCWRFDTATEMLEDVPVLSVEYMRDVMDAVHQDGPGSRTLYTNVYDLARRKVYLYHYHDYEQVVVFDLEEELAKGTHSYDLPTLFPPNLRAEHYSAPLLRDYNDLIESRLVEADPEVLAVFAGDYVLSEGLAVPDGLWAPDGQIAVVPRGASLMMIRPDSHRNELFPQGETSFFAVTWAGRGYKVWFEADFGVGAEGRVQYLELAYNAKGRVRYHRLSSHPPAQGATVPMPTSTPRPTHTAGPTVTAVPTPEPTLTAGAPVVESSGVSTPASPGAKGPAGARWGGAIVPTALLAAAIGWLAIRRRRPAQR